jgi:hypothetical protein
LLPGVGYQAVVFTAITVQATKMTGLGHSPQNRDVRAMSASLPIRRYRFAMTSTSEQSLSEAETDLLRTVYSLLDSFHTLSRKMPISFARVFLGVCLHPNRCVEELARECGTSSGVMSRTLGDIGDCNRYHLPGMGPVEAVGDPMDRRLVLIRPSHRGAALARQMVSAMKRRQHVAAA